MVNEVLILKMVYQQKKMPDKLYLQRASRKSLKIKYFLFVDQIIKIKLFQQKNISNFRKQLLDLIFLVLFLQNSDLTDFWHNYSNNKKKTFLKNQKVCLQFNKIL